MNTNSLKRFEKKARDLFFWGKQNKKLGVEKKTMEHAKSMQRKIFIIKTFLWKIFKSLIFSRKIIIINNLW